MKQNILLLSLLSGSLLFGQSKDYAYQPVAFTSVKLTDKIQQKIISQTKLIRTNNDEANFVLSGYIINYDPSQTVGISNSQTQTNRLTVTVHIILRDNVENKTQEFDVTRNFDFNASLSLQQAEADLLEKEIIPTITDEIFNKIFSNW